MRDTAVARGRRRAATLLLLTVYGACGQTDGGAGVAVETLETGRVVVRHPDPGSATTLRLVEVLSIGTIEGTGLDVFGNVGSLAVGRNGVVYVGDRIAAEVRAFTPDGEFLRVMARRGSGPGEIPPSVFPLNLLWQEPNRLWIGAPPTLMSLDSLGHVGEARYALGGIFVWTGRADTLDGIYSTLRSPLGMDPSTETLRISVRKLRVLGDSLVSPAGELFIGFEENRVERTVTRGGATGHIMGSLPMRSETVWDVDPSGDIWLAQTGSYRLHRVTLAGDTIRTVELARAPEPLSASERDSIARNTTAFSAAELPTHKPLIRHLRVGRNGWLWVRRRASAPSEDSWDVFDRCGRYLGSATPPVPLDVSPWLPVGASGILGVTRGAFDVEYVVHLRLERNDGQPVTSGDCTF